MSHSCPVRLCVRDGLPDHLFLCAPHWRLVPPAMRRAVYTAYAHGLGLGSPELRDAHAAAVLAVNRQLGLIPPPRSEDP